MNPAVTWLPGAVCALVLGWVLVLGGSRTRRLDRLHIRVDAGRDGLDAALERRAAAALLAAAAAGIAGAALGVASRAALDAAGGTGEDRETRENALGRALAGLDRAAVPGVVRDELVEAEQRLVLARRVHNDAVRDTLGLRSRRMVRWLRLAGAAPMPAYFEIADPATGFGVRTPAPVAVAEPGADLRG